MAETPESFESRLEKTKTILEQLSNSDLPLDEGMKLYKAGMEELKIATEMLERAKLEFQTLENPDHEPSDT